MPIRESQRRRYPKDWRAISLRIRRDRARWACECSGQCGRHEPPCEARHGEPHPVTGSRVVLTVAHLDHTPEHCEPGNLLAMCQRCHLSYDAHRHAHNARQTRRRRKAAGELFEVEPHTP
jgi:hypothetical protein